MSRITYWPRRLQTGHSDHCKETKKREGATQREKEKKRPKKSKQDRYRTGTRGLVNKNHGMYTRDSREKKTREAKRKNVGNPSIFENTCWKQGDTAGSEERLVGWGGMSDDDDDDDEAKLKNNGHNRKVEEEKANYALFAQTNDDR